jgi:hypothetical protein
MIEKLPPEIATLLEREAAAYPEDVALKDVARRRIESAIALGVPTENGGAPPALATATAKGMTAPLVALVGVGAFVAGTAFGIALHRPESARSQPSATPTVAIAAMPVIETAAPLEDKPSSSSTAVSPPLVVASASSNANDDPSTQTGDLIRERELLDVARAALSHGRPLDAIAAAKRHEKRWPKGYLVEEREVVWIQALVATGDDDQAKMHGAAFHRNFPHSALSAAVDTALQDSNSVSNMTDSGAP